MIQRNEFLEYAEFSGNMYGTSLKEVMMVSKTKVCVLEIEMQGIQILKEKKVEAKYLFIQPPSLEILEQRLRSRNTETEESIKARLLAAKKELDYAKLGVHDLIIINNDLDQAFRELEDWTKTF